MQKDIEINVVGLPLAPCSQAPLTGFFRDGSCNTCAQDTGSHTVCAVMTAEFLAFSKYLGNDLSTPRPEFGFAGLKAGDRWCLCAGRFFAGPRRGLRASGATHHRPIKRLWTLFRLKFCGSMQRPDRGRDETPGLGPRVHLNSQSGCNGEDILVTTAAHIHANQVIGGQFRRDFHHMGQSMARL